MPGFFELRRHTLSLDMDTRFLDQLAQHLRKGKSPACRRAIERLLTEMKERCEHDEYESQAEAERAFRKLVDTKPTCSRLDT
jgi:hypothetical protein